MIGSSAGGGQDGGRLRGDPDGLPYLERFVPEHREGLGVIVDDEVLGVAEAVLGSQADHDEVIYVVSSDLLDIASLPTTYRSMWRLHPQQVLSHVGSAAAEETFMAFAHTDPVGDASNRHLAMGRRRKAIAAALVYGWLRVMYVLAMGVFETPDTESYRSGQHTRPPIGAASVSWLGDTPYVLLSSLISTGGFLALAWAVWNPGRRSLSLVMVGSFGLVSLLPMVMVYEHWLVPDSLLTGLALMALSLAIRRLDVPWYPWLLVALCMLITLTKEVGFGVVLLVGLVALLRGAVRPAVVAFVLSAILFAIVVLPASNREGRVLWFQPADTELTMERFRVVIAGMIWPDLSPELAEVRGRAAECGMTNEQLIAETFRLTNSVVAFRDCAALWDVADELSQIHILEAHARNPVHVRTSIERGFTPDMSAMSSWGGYLGDHTFLMRADQLVAGAVALLPFAAVAVAMARHRGRRLALVAMAASAMAFVAALVDPSSQDRHTFVFRIAAFAIGLMAVAASTARDTDDNGSELAAISEDETPMPARELQPTN